MTVNYTEEYSPGTTIYYAYHNPLTGNRKLYELKITKVYPDMIFAWEDRGCAYMIGAEDEDNIFLDYHTAQAFFNQAQYVEG